MSFDFSHRKSVIKIKLEDKDGKALANEEITVNQTQNEFLFGCGGFEAVELAGGSFDGTPHPPERVAAMKDSLGKIFRHNNFATLPFYIGRYEREEGKPDEKRTKAAAEWYIKRNIKPKGHPLCWHTVCAPWLMNYSNKEIFEKLIKRIERDVTAFKGIIDIWDVINEVVIMPDFREDNAVTRVCKEMGRVELVKAVFEAARRSNPDALLLLNDYIVDDKYRDLIDECLQAGVKIDVIGIQTHQHRGYWGKEKMYEVLERFAKFGLPLHYTENTLISGDLMPSTGEFGGRKNPEDWPSTTEGEERQKNEILEFYSILFAHPQVKAITNWSPRDGGWLNAPAGFLRLDNSEKPSLIALGEKITKEWSTNTKLVSNVEGIITLDGFRGTYELTAKNQKGSFVLDGKNESLDLKLA